MKYYSTSAIDKRDATYNLIFGERSNGKTYALLLKTLKDYVKNNHQMAYVRRWKEDITGRRAAQLFAGINENGEVSKLTKGEFTGVHYFSGKFYLCTYDDNGKAVYGDTNILGFTFSLSDGEHNKSTSYPNIKTIVFDEFLTNKIYLNDEFVHFMNTVSTIVRKREDVKIYMLGNTVNKYCPYFKEMGLEHIQKMKQGTIDVYKYGDSHLTVAVEYCKTIDNGDSKGANKYFAFNNPKLSMITGGAWELNIYPHLPYKYKDKNILLTYFIDFSDNIYQCEIINIGDIYFTYIHIKTTPIKNIDTDLIYCLDYNPKPNYNRSIFKPVNNVQKKIAWFFANDKVFYQDNNTGDAIANYLKICKRG
ncbi:MAG: phage DNA encapsidation protein [Shewanella sp.]